MLIFQPGQQTRNAITVELGPQAPAFNLYAGTSGTSELIVDESGYYGG